MVMAELNQIAQSPIQTGLEPSWTEDIHSFPGQPVCRTVGMRPKVRFTLWVNILADFVGEFFTFAPL